MVYRLYGTSFLAISLVIGSHLVSVSFPNMNHSCVYDKILQQNMFAYTNRQGSITPCL